MNSGVFLGGRMDHPRSRGVYSCRIGSIFEGAGSSPLARGLPYSPSALTAANRIIPARAGFTLRPDGPSCGYKDHPRSRGVYMSTIGGDVRVRGSSPLARGLRWQFLLRLGRARIIPARAGFTRSGPLRRGRHRDHPRSRGVYVGVRRNFSMLCGSSPLARGLL